ncbi:MAG: HD domain-containing protein [Dorea sp.]|nr:HD domain-containing protein [Dorea sp.]
MDKGRFKDVAAVEGSENWEKLVQRERDLKDASDEIRTPFVRDYTRILHSLAYSRLKHKTQVFFNIENDHICTRMEHVAHVESVSSAIANYLGLNCELTKAISIGHDIGHAPFGHHGEKVINKLAEKHLGTSFWHERNGLRYIDDIELLENNYKIYKNLSLTYAVRDGIIAHCGEIDENGLKPRTKYIDLSEFDRPGKYQPVTWEGCVVKISDKIAYVGRDIADALCLGFLDAGEKNRLKEMARINDHQAINTTVIMSNLIKDICVNSSPENGICLSEKFMEQIDKIKSFNYGYIYDNKRLDPFKSYAKMIIKNIFKILLNAYAAEYTLEELKKVSEMSETLYVSFSKFLARYCENSIVLDDKLQDLSFRCDNKKIYGKLENEKTYIQAILDYISGMTDKFAIKIFNEMLAY